MRVMWPIPSANTGAARPSSKPLPVATWNTQALPSCANFSSSDMRASRSLTRSPIAAEETRYVGCSDVVMVPSWTVSFLDRAGGEATDDLAFCERVEEQGGQHRQAGV